ncbi:hypothetical protein A2U01_0110464 [Trifolium medium]|uniref:Uncharacterized protein n=1 Tax=Trifolium medium TaxID=97028 RepID=A0A392VLF6_9FABA|nr:hypothetical protein [Trifolium medium]
MRGNHEVGSPYVEKVIIPGAITITDGGGRESHIEESSVAGGFVSES